MWPTMVRSQPLSKSRAAISSTEGTDSDLLSLLPSSNKSRLQREMEALEKWLEDDVDLEETNPPKRDEDDPWSFPPGPSSSSKVVTGEDSKASVAHGFDDDFSEFVSAPPAESSPPQGAADEDVDSELPSQSEVREASERIFRGSAPAESGASPGLFSQGEDEEGSASSAFDLSHVLSALQGMKEEIAAIPDERERRKAAAKVALGLVYGLEDTNDELDFSV